MGIRGIMNNFTNTFCYELRKHVRKKLTASIRYKSDYIIGKVSMGMCPNYTHDS